MYKAKNQLRAPFRTTSRTLDSIANFQINGMCAKHPSDAQPTPLESQTSQSSTTPPQSRAPNRLSDWVASSRRLFALQFGHGVAKGGARIDTVEGRKIASRACLNGGVSRTGWRHVPAGAYPGRGRVTSRDIYAPADTSRVFPGAYPGKGAGSHGQEIIQR